MLSIMTIFTTLKENRQPKGCFAGQRLEHVVEAGQVDSTCRLTTYVDHLENHEDGQRDGGHAKRASMRRTAGIAKPAFYPNLSRFPGVIRSRLERHAPRPSSYVRPDGQRRSTRILARPGDMPAVDLTHVVHVRFG